jgi:hypothetical protein
VFRKILLQYVNPLGELPQVKGHGDLLLIGSAAGVWEDLRRYEPIHGKQDRMAVNDMMSHYPGRLDHGVTLHKDKLPGFGFNQAYRASHEAWPPMQTHSKYKHDWVKHVWPIHRDGGTSGLFGVFIGLLMGYDRVILAGIPCDDSPRFFDPPWQKHEQFGRETTHQEWLKARDRVFDGRVKSLSGNTKIWLGEP